MPRLPWWKAEDKLPPIPSSPTPGAPQALTIEMLDWYIAASEALLSCENVTDDNHRRPRQAIRESLKLVDHLYVEVRA